MSTCHPRFRPGAVSRDARVSPDQLIPGRLGDELWAVVPAGCCASRRRQYPEHRQLLLKHVHLRRLPPQPCPRPETEITSQVSHRRRRRRIFPDLTPRTPRCPPGMRLAALRRIAKAPDRATGSVRAEHQSEPSTSGHVPTRYGPNSDPAAKRSTRHVRQRHLAGRVQSIAVRSPPPPVPPADLIANRQNHDPEHGRDPPRISQGGDHADTSLGRGWWRGRGELYVSHLLSVLVAAELRTLARLSIAAGSNDHDRGPRRRGVRRRGVRGFAIWRRSASRLVAIRRATVMSSGPQRGHAT